ncbi:DNA-binding protein [Pseudomonas lalucatii]|uniref:DNA-binding protein n=1 Tax=Pseudomonas lalucatii TaxID=1424203 RepID=A0ABS5PZJ9_9PSED|nr:MULTISPECIES: DNA-binding protein [Pseudomonas]MBS7661926.1 DNA-binding protein [Pseudomonas lalucatii]MBS7726210.1 DNA-binding protein [Pseudomonas lalucatii]QLC73841.1 DNA-binding protein [Pseudomonas sp. LPB0260]QLC76615.1 DNA-binding protein [Pseudomonas sp. LPB0260]
MEQSGVVGFNAQGNAERITDFRDSPFCSQLVFAEMLGIEDVTQDVVRGWVESQAIPTVKIGRRRVINLHRIRRDLEKGKTIFCAGDYADE